MINILVSLLVLALVIYVCYLIVGMLPLPEPAKRIVSLILAVVFLVMMLRYLGFA